MSPTNHLHSGVLFLLVLDRCAIIECAVEARSAGFAGGRREHVLGRGLGEERLGLGFHESLLSHARQLLRRGRHDGIGWGDVGSLLSVLSQLRLQYLAVILHALCVIAIGHRGF